MKELWIIANFKSNKSLPEVLDWVGEVGPKVPKRDNLKVVVCPTATALEEVKKAMMIGNFPLLVGSQDLSPYQEGSYTGEEAASILKQFVDLSILGHSERRQNLKETDEMVSKKVEQALEHQIIPLVCVQDKDTPIPEKCHLVAYEPVFAIGTDNPDTPANAEAVAQAILSRQPDIKILYGGSVNSENAKAFTKQENISGLLIGKASLDPQEFVKIINASIEF